MHKHEPEIVVVVAHLMAAACGGKMLAVCGKHEPRHCNYVQSPPK